MEPTRHRVMSEVLRELRGRRTAAAPDRDTLGRSVGSGACWVGPRSSTRRRGSGPPIPSLPLGAVAFSAV